MSDDKELENREGTFVGSISVALEPEKIEEAELSQAETAELTGSGYPDFFDFKCPYCGDEQEYTAEFVLNLKPSQTVVDLPCRCAIGKYRLEDALEAAANIE